VQVRGEECQRPEQRYPFEEDDDEHRARPADAQHVCRLAQRMAAARLRRRGGISVVSRPPQQRAGGEEAQRQQGKRRPPQAVFGGQAAHPLPAGEAEDLTGEEARQHRLTALVRNGVANPGHRHRDHRRTGRAGGQPCPQQRRETGRERAGGRGAARGEHGQRDHLPLAEAIGERAKDELHQPVSDRKDGNDVRRVGDRHGEATGERRQLRVGNAHRRRTAESAG
jgi:hypothetical protein